jgi:hypothetical protein
MRNTHSLVPALQGPEYVKSKGVAFPLYQSYAGPYIASITTTNIHFSPSDDIQALWTVSTSVTKPSRRSNWQQRRVQRRRCHGRLYAHERAGHRRDYDHLSGRIRQWDARRIVSSAQVKNERRCDAIR